MRDVTEPATPGMLRADRAEEMLPGKRGRAFIAMKKRAQAAEAALTVANSRETVLREVLEQASVALHNAVLAITLQLSPDHDAAVAGARALGAIDGALRTLNEALKTTEAGE